jgi:hypothetical protein
MVHFDNTAHGGLDAEATLRTMAIHEYFIPFLSLELSPARRDTRVSTSRQSLCAIPGVLFFDHQFGASPPAHHRGRAASRDERRVTKGRGG